MPRLGVNVDHVATLRQARATELPSPVWAAKVAQEAGCDGIVCHLREDRRHIQEKDLWAIRRSVRTSLNLEMSMDQKIVRIALKVKPDQVTLVPERRQELTTEGGLDLSKNRVPLEATIRSLSSQGIKVSLFLDPDARQLRLAKELGAPMVELHTGLYAHGRTSASRNQRLRQLQEAARMARRLGFVVAAGHGLDYENVRPVVAIPQVEELNIGFSIVARALHVGFFEAVREMCALVHGEEMPCVNSERCLEKAR